MQASPIVVQNHANKPSPKGGYGPLIIGTGLLAVAAVVGIVLGVDEFLAWRAQQRIKQTIEQVSGKQDELRGWEIARSTWMQSLESAQESGNKELILESRKMVLKCDKEIARIKGNEK